MNILIFCHQTKIDKKSAKKLFCLLFKSSMFETYIPKGGEYETTR